MSEDREQSALALLHEWEASWDELENVDSLDLWRELFHEHNAIESKMRKFVQGKADPMAELRAEVERLEDIVQHAAVEIAAVIPVHPDGSRNEEVWIESASMPNKADRDCVWLALSILREDTIDERILNDKSR